MTIVRKILKFRFMRVVFNCRYPIIIKIVFGLSVLILYEIYGCSPTIPIIENNPPVAVIRPISSAKQGGVVELDGRDSFDPDGDDLTYQWSFLQGPAQVSFDNAEAAVTKFVAVDRGTYRFELVVSDGKGLGRAEVEVEITATDPDPDLERVATPVFDPVEGTTFKTTLDVFISCETPHARIFYSLDGSIPGPEKGLEYKAPISLMHTTRILAVAVCEGKKNSELAEANFTNLGTVAMPKFDLPDGTVFQYAIQINITCESEGAAIYYTTDGTIPTIETGTLYTQPIILEKSTILKAIGVKEGMIESLIASAVYTKLGTTSPVTFSPGAGEVFQDTLEVTLSCETPDATIYYTLDGSEPDKETGLIYSTPLNLTETTLIKAIACKENIYDAPIAQAQYTRWETVAEPKFIPADQRLFQDSIIVQLTCETPQATIVYTTDGKKPTREYGNIYTAPLILTNNTTINAFAYKEGMFDSAKVTAGYVRLYPVANPVFKPGNNYSFQDELYVTISTATPQAQIRYTTDGTDPSPTHGHIYTGPIRLTSTITIKAMAFKTYMIDTPVFSATYTKVLGGTQKWIYETDSSIDSSVAIGTDGTIYVGSYDQYLHAVNADGTRRWTFHVEGWIFSSPAVARDGTIYVGSGNGKLYAIYPDGTLKWTYNTGKTIVSSPATSPDGTVYVHVDGKLVAIRSDGTLKWQCATSVSGSYNYSSPVIARDGTIYIGSVDKKIYAITSNGTKKWTFQTGNYVDSSAAIGADGTIYIGSGDRKLYAINPDGSMKWSYLTGGYIDSSAAVASDGTIYVGSADGKLYALNSDGTLKWTFSTNKEIHASPVIRSDGGVYIASMDGSLYAVGTNGTQKWKFTMGGAADASPSIGNDGTIYVGSKDRKLYAIRGPGTLADMPWPKFRYNERQSGNLNDP